MRAGGVNSGGESSMLLDRIETEIGETGEKIARMLLAA
jgi:hypothetical protein